MRAHCSRSRCCSWTPFGEQPTATGGSVHVCRERNECRAAAQTLDRVSGSTSHMALEAIATEPCNDAIGGGWSRVVDALLAFEGCVVCRKTSARGFEDKGVGGAVPA